MEAVERGKSALQSGTDFAVSVTIGTFLASLTWALNVIGETGAQIVRPPSPIAAILPAVAITVNFEREQTRKVKNKLPWAILSSFLGFVVAAVGGASADLWIAYSFIALGSSIGWFGFLPLMRAIKSPTSRSEP